TLSAPAAGTPRTPNIGRSGLRCGCARGPGTSRRPRRGRRRIRKPPQFAVDPAVLARWPAARRTRIQYTGPAEAGRHTRPWCPPLGGPASPEVVQRDAAAADRHRVTDGPRDELLCVARGVGHREPEREARGERRRVRASGAVGWLRRDP